MKQALTATLFLLSSAAFAHDTWLLPAGPHLEPGQSVVFELTSAMDFPHPETPVKPDRLLASKVRLRGETQALSTEPQATFLRLTARLEPQGVATAWIETHPRTLELTPAQVEEYLKEIGQAETVGAEWRKSPTREWRESYVKIAKTFVRVGEPTDDRSWADPLGLPLEIVPEGDPTALRTGERLSVRVLWSGKPLAGLPLGAVASGGRSSLQTTGPDGRVSILFDRPGPWLLRATLIRADEGSPGQWNSHFTTLTLYADPKAAAIPPDGGTSRGAPEAGVR